VTLLLKSKFEKKLGSYSVGGAAAALTDPNWQTRAQDYRRLLASRMIPLESAEIRKRLPSAMYHVSLKVDGEFNLLVFEKGEIFTVNPGGTVRTGLPFQNEAIELLTKAGIKQTVMAGELFYRRPDKKRPRVHDVSRVARQPASQAELEGLHFAVFDALEIDNKPWPGFNDPEWKRIIGMFTGGKMIQPVESMWLNDIAAIEKQYKFWIDSGAEGAVLRSEAAGQFKVKPRHNLDAVVIGFTEGTDDRKGMIHDILLALMRPDGGLHILGRTGGGFTEADRRAFLSDLRDMIVPSDYTEVNDQVAYHMVRPEWVVEVSVLDLLSQSTRGASINRMVLNWNKGEGKYETIRRLPSVGMISPQYVRRREDKGVNPTDIRMQQVADLVEVPMIDRDARQLSQTASEVLKREVYTKVIKGATMVRKFVLWQTNKEKENEDFPAFVLHFTDFSPNRKTPLERDARVSSSRDQIDELWNEMVAENIAKGWEKVGGAKAEPETSTAVAEAKPAPKKRATKKKAEE